MSEQVQYEDPTCPTCQATLLLRPNTDTVIWDCPNAHGELVSIAVMYDSLQGDEIEELWQVASASPAGPRACPICKQPMKQATIVVDDDESYGNNASGKGQSVTLDVCLDDSGIWFDKGEWDVMPRHEEHEGFKRFIGRFGHKHKAD